jgi:hypothetical protein
MAQKILLRRGGLANLNSGATIGVTKGEQLFASGTLANTNIENLTFVANADGNGTFQAVGRLFTGTASPTSFNSKLDGLPYYKTDSEALYRLGTATALDLTGNLEGNTVSAMTITTLTGTTINLSGDITGSNLLLSGDANINGNIVLGGNITIGDENTDNINIGGEFTSNLIPDADDTYALGSASRRWNIYGVDSSISGSFSGSFQGNFIGGIFDIAGGGQGSGTDTINANDTITFTNASDHGFHFDITNNQVSLATPQSLKTTASPTFAGVTAGNITVGVSNDNTITTSTGNLTIDSAGGTVAVNDNLTIAGDLTVSGTTTTVDSTTVNIGDNIIVLNAAGTVADGGVQVIDTTGTAGTGSILWNATNDYWYAGVSGSTHFRLATFTNATPSTNAVPRIDSNKRLVAGSITDTTTAVTISQPTTLQSTLEVDGTVQLDAAGGSDAGTNSSNIVFRNSSNQIGYISTTETTDVLDGILGYKASDGALVFSTVIDGGTF